MSKRPFLVIVSEDRDNIPQTPVAFLTKPGQGVNIGQNIWHGVLTTLGEVSDFVVVDRGGPGNNLEEFFFDEGFVVNFAD